MHYDKMEVEEALEQLMPGATLPGTGAFGKAAILG